MNELDSATVALMALSWILDSEPRAVRFLALTGLTPDLLRSGAARADTQVAVLDFLAGHEADLVAAAKAIAIEPGEIVAARDALANRQGRTI